GKGSERVACLCVPRDNDSREEIAEHFAKVSADLPYWKRVKILHFWHADLPRTASRKVKRPLVVAELQRLERAAAAGAQATPGASGDGWFYDLLADLAQKPHGSVAAHTRLAADLGFDSLLTAELVVALEKAGLRAPSETQLASLVTAGDLARSLERDELT